MINRIDKKKLEKLYESNVQNVIVDKINELVLELNKLRTMMDKLPDTSSVKRGIFRNDL